MSARPPVKVFVVAAKVSYALPELQMWVIEDADGRRFTVDLDTDLGVDMAPGLAVSAVVNDEGYALKVSADPA